MRSLIFFILTITLSLPATSRASDEIDQIRAQLMALLERVESLEAENQQLRVEVKQTAERTDAVAVSTESKRNWTNTIAVSGDLRARYESFDIDDRDDRERSRVRARLTVKAKPTDNTEVGIGLASGGDDPLSTNQTLGGGASTKDVILGLAYFKWQVKPGLTLTGGKSKNPFFRPGGNGLLWDGDLRHEGLSLAYSGDSIFLNTGLHFLESDTKRSNARIAYGFQSGYKSQIGASKLTAGLGYFKISAAGQSSWYDEDFFGNTVSCAGDTCVYANDFNELELFAELKTIVRDQPLTLFADYVQNQEASDNDTAWALGFKFGKAGNPKTWELGYTYQDIEADAVIGLWSDSDFAGGDTDAKGHILRGAWAPSKKWKIGLTYFINETGVELGDGNDYNRLQLDWAYKF
jgi:hypothetical protein